MLSDPSALVQSRAAVYLAVVEGKNPVDAMKRSLRQARTGAETLWILNDMAYLKNRNPEWDFSLTDEDVLVKCQGADWRVDYLK